MRSLGHLLRAVGVPLPQLIGHVLLVLAVQRPTDVYSSDEAQKASRRETCPSSTSARMSCSRTRPWQRPNRRKAKSLARRRARPISSRRCSRPAGVHSLPRKLHYL
jgi:hypothetical protein